MIDQIILSCNEDETYSSFWPIVSWAYKRMFPEVTVHLAFLTNREEDDELVKEFRTHGKVTLFRPIEGIPEFGIAKTIRFILASQQGNDVCMIEDIDEIPLSKTFITDKLSQRPKDVLLCVGEEANGWVGSWPVSYMTCEGHLWKKFINPKDLSYVELINSFRDYFFDIREKIDLETDFKNDIYYSDERRLRKLLRDNPVPILSIRRGYDDFRTCTIDRHFFDKESNYWHYDRQKLINGEYVSAHCIRGFDQYKEHFAPIIEFIENNYP